MMKLTTPAAAMMFLATLVIIANTAAAHYHHHHHHSNWHWDVDGNQKWEKESEDTLFSKCVCWNSTTNNWCGNTANETSFFNRDACQQWTWRAALWGLPAIMLGLCYVFFPFFFFVFRCICNCCGGRKPSYGCLCPHDNTCCCPKLTSGKVEERTYSNRAIFLTKFFFTVAFGIQIYYAVGSYVTNHRVHESTVDIINDVNTSASQLGSTMVNAGQIFQKLNAEHASFTPINSSDEIISATATYHHRISQIDNVLSKIHDAESNQSWGRQADMYRVPSLPLAIALIVAFAMIFNGRGFVITILGAVISWTAAFVTIAFIVHMILAQVSTQACNTYNGTVVPTIVGAIESNHGCNSGRVLNPINATVSNFQDLVCNGASATPTTEGIVGLTQICEKFFVCANITELCKPVSFNATLQTGAIADIHDIIGVPAFSHPKAEFESTIKCNFPANYNGTQTCSIANYALYGSSTGIWLQVTKLMSQINKYGADVEYLSSQAFPQFYNCTALKSKLYGQVHDTLCGDDSFDKNYTNLAITLLAQMINCIPLIVCTIVGAKRFLKMNRTEREKENLVYGFLITDDEAAKYAGSPIGSPHDVNNHHAQYGTVVQAEDVHGHQQHQGGYYTSADAQHVQNQENAVSMPVVKEQPQPL